MSHISVLVITPSKPTDADLTAALQPFHEFECTGIDDQYVVEVDQTAELRELFASDTTRRFKDAAGVLHDPYDDRFYREWTPEEWQTRAAPPLGTGFGDGLEWTSKDWQDGAGYRSKVHYCPEGYEDVSVPCSDIQTFREFVEARQDKPAVPFGEEPDTADVHKYGYALLDEAGEISKVVDRTNPNDKWDWWVVGGRYGFRLAVAGCERMVDSARVGQLDWARMKARNEETRRAEIAELTRKGATRDEVERACLADPRIQATWRELQEPKPRGSDFYDWAVANDPDGEVFAKVARQAWGLPVLGEAKALDEWIAAAPSLTTWAVLLNGEWTEKGSMGWFGMSSDNKDEAAWEKWVADMLASLHETSWITVVDCHT